MIIYNCLYIFISQNTVRLDKDFTSMLLFSFCIDCQRDRLKTKNRILFKIQPSKTITYIKDDFALCYVLIYQAANDPGGITNPRPELTPALVRPGNIILKLISVNYGGGGVYSGSVREISFEIRLI